MFETGILVGAFGMVAVHVVAMWMYKRNLTEKADAPKRGQSNVEFILGRPYVILHEADYARDCKPWYTKGTSKAGDAQ